MTKRLTSEDYRKELKNLEKQKRALEARIVRRTNELCERYPDVQIGYNVSKSNANIPVYSGAYIKEKMSYDTALVIMTMIERELAKRHPHKQTEIKFK